MTERQASQLQRRELGRRRRATAVGAGVALALIGVAYAGSDHPPPVGFLMFVVSAVALALVVRVLGPAALRRWDVLGAVKAVAMTALVGAIAAGGFWMLAWVVGGEPSVSPSVGDRALGLAVMMCVGALVSVTVVVLLRWLDRRA